MGKIVRHCAENIDLTSILETKIGRIRLGKIPHVWLDSGNGATDGDPLLVPSTGGTFTGDVKIEGNLHATGNITADGHITLGDTDTDTIDFKADIVSNILPDTTNSYDLGSTLKRWKNGFFAGNIIINGTVDGINISDIKLNNMPASATDDITANTNKIINVVDPVGSQDVATKSYVDTFVPPSGVIDHDNLTNVTSDQHHAKIHASGHVDGTDDIQNATNSQKGLATSGHIIEIEANTVHKTSDGTDHTYINQDIRTSASPTFENITIPASGVVDTRDVSVDGAKLDGIAVNANNYTHPNHTGEVTSVADGDQIIINDAVTYAKMQNVVANNVILGNNNGAGSDVEELDASAVRTIINVENGATADQTKADIDGLGLSHDSLADVSVDDHHARDHAATHTNGTDDIQSATNAQKGLATSSHITAIEANTSASHAQGTDTTLGTQVADLNMGGNDIDKLGVLNFGDPAVSGTYRIRYSDPDLVFERYNGSAWIEKFAVTN